MSYSMHATIQLLQNEVGGCSTEIQELSAKVMEQEQELSAMKREVGIAREEHDHTKHILKDTIKNYRLFKSNAIVHVIKHTKVVKSLRQL